MRKYAPTAAPPNINMTVPALIFHGFDCYPVTGGWDNKHTVQNPAPPNPIYAQTRSYPHPY